MCQGMSGKGGRTTETEVNLLYCDCIEASAETDEGAPRLNSILFSCDSMKENLFFDVRGTHLPQQLWPKTTLRL